VGKSNKTKNIYTQNESEKRKKKAILKNRLFSFLKASIFKQSQKDFLIGCHLESIC